MRSLIFVLGACALAAACSRGNGTTSTMSMQPVVSVIGCVSQQGNDLVLTTSNRTPTGTSGTRGTSGSQSSARSYRLIDEGHTGVDRFVDRQVQITGKVEPTGTEEAAKMPAIRVTQMSSMGGCQ